MARVVTKKAITSNLSGEKMIVLLEKMATLSQPARLQELAKLTGMNASTLLRFLAPLIEYGYVSKVMDDGRYQLTLKLCGLADNVRSGIDVRTAALPHMRDVVQAFRETVSLSVESDMSVQYVEVAPGPNTTLISLQRVGHTAPMHCTGAGKALLLRYTADEINRFIATKGLPRFTDHTITNPKALIKELEKVRRAGCAHDNGELEEGARFVAAPVRDYTGNIVASLSVGGPAGRMNDALITEHLPILIEAAARTSFALGWQPQAT